MAVASPAAQGDRPRARLGYWTDIEVLRRELRAFMATVDDRRMPKAQELARAGRWDIVAAIRRHGGFAAVAARVGIARHSTGKPRGYWSSVLNLAAELRDYIERCGEPEVMPTIRELKRAGRGDLITGVRRHGGMAAVARLFHLRLKPSAPHYWAQPGARDRDLAELQHELARFCRARGSIGVMPTFEQLRRAGRSDLLGAIARQGGFAAVADVAPLRRASSEKPRGYWTSWATLAAELAAFMGQAGLNRMPTTRQLIAAGRQDLLQAMKRQGGLAAVAIRAGLEPPHPRLRRATV